MVNKEELIPDRWGIVESYHLRSSGMNSHEGDRRSFCHLWCMDPAPPCVRKIILLSYLCIFLVFFLQSRPCIGCDKAQELYEQASGCFHAAVLEEQNSYQKAFVIYRASLSYLERILSEYPDSYQASALKSGDLAIGNLTYSIFKDSFLRSMKLKAEGEGDLSVCARLVVESANNNSYRSMSFVWLASLYIRMGKEEQALQMIKTARDLDDGDALKSGVIKGYLETGRPYEALELSREISNPIGRSGDVARCIKALSPGSRKERVFQILSEEENKLKHSDGDPDKPGLLRMLAEIFYQQGYREKALQLVDQAFVFAKASEKLVDRISDLEGIAFALARMEEYDLADETVNLIDVRLQNIIRKELRRNMAGMMLQSGQYDKALAMAMSIEDQWYKADTLMEMASSLAGSGDRVRAYAILSKLHDDMKEVKDYSTVVGIHIHLIKVYKAMGDEVNASVEVAHAIAVASKEEPQQRDRSLMWISEECSKLGYYAQASKIAEMIHIPEYKAEALVELVAELMEKDQESALRNLADALRSAIEISDSRKRNDLMRRITRQHVHLGQVEKAEQLSHILEKRDSKTVLEAIALYYAKVGDFNRALEYAMRLDKANYDQQVTLMRIAIRYAEMGYCEKALQTAAKISEPRSNRYLFRDEALDKISRCYIKAGNYDEALQATSAITDYCRIAFIIMDIAEIYHKNSQRPGDRTKKILHAIIRSADEMQ